MRRAVAVLWVLFAVLWVAMAIEPLDRKNWLLENLLVFLGVPAFWLIQRRVPLSVLSHGLFVLFLGLHVVGSHWSYSRVPIDWAALGFERNHYDRVVHFAYGLLLAPPIMELLERTGRGKGLWGASLAVQAVLASSALYEIIEWITVIVVASDVGAAFLGTQGDEFDAVTDMALAGLGALLAMMAWVAFDSLRPAKARARATSR